MSVRIRMKRLGRAHRPFYRICAMDKRAPRDGRVLEELGTYDPSVPDTDARAILKADRIDYWLGVGAQPSDKVSVLIKKYGSGGSHVDAQKAALDKLAQPKSVPDPGKPASMPKPPEPEEPPKADAPVADAPVADKAEATSGDESSAEETATKETPTEDAPVAEKEAPNEEETAKEE